MIDRRTFLGAVGAAVVLPRLAPAASIARPGMQLYTVRGELEKDFDGTLAKIAAIGYREVEFAGYFGRTPAQVRDSLKRHGLTAPSAHIDFASLTGDRWTRALDDARAIGHQYLVNAWVDESIRNQAGAWQRIAATYNTAAAAAKQHGIQFAYHNHHFEFYPRADAGGKLPMDLILESCDPALVKIELDLCWISAAGKDPLDYFRRAPGRFPLVHVKGLRKVPPASAEPPPIDRVLTDITDVGRDDAIDWPRIFARSAQAGITHYFVEHDNPKDPFESLRNSYAYVTKLKF
jgi:sugar phosphate isomerase/epimerase